MKRWSSIARFVGLWGLLLLLPITIMFGQTGKIAGRVIDAETEEPLPGVNVILEDTDQGAATDQDGYYTIVNVDPGSYTLTASFIGYAETDIQNVRVNIDLTTTINFELQPEAITGEEVVVEAAEPVVKPDVSANVANVELQEMVNVPVAGVSEYIDLQAGIEPDMHVRGGDLGEVSFIVDGMATRGGRDNQPFTEISYTAVQELQVQTGGFNAEYGNVRSGLVNVVTRKPSAQNYSLDVLMRYTHPQKKHFGGLPNNADAYWIRPFMDPEVAFIGTHDQDPDDGDGVTPWDHWTRIQYPRFVGWNQVSETLMGDDDPNNDLTPEQLQEVFQWRHRKDFEITIPDYVGDITLGGPLPFINRPLGNLRFLASYRNLQRAYIVPQERDAYNAQTAQLKLISDITSNMKLQLNGLYAVQSGLNASNWRVSSMFDGRNPNYPWQGRGQSMVDNLSGDQRDQLFGWNFWNLSDTKRNTIGLELTHTLSAQTFYEVNLQRNYTDYWVRTGPFRDTTTVVRTVGPMELDESPYGYADWSENSFSGLRLAGHWGKPRGNSDVTLWTGSFDISSQVNRFTHVKAGTELNLYNYNIDEARIDPAHLNQQHYWNWNRKPIQGAVYAQSKLEFEGMIANLGVRVDHFDGNGSWYDFEPYERAFSAKVGFDQLDEVLVQEAIEPQTEVSPRLGVAFPVTANSKLFFNYGHFRQMLNARDLFEVQAGWLGSVENIGNPNHPMPRTIAYELGYDHNLFQQYLLRISGYYKDISMQPRGIDFTSIDQIITYTTLLPYNYEDIRGFEITLEKNVTGWFGGFINYTYLVTKAGNFGYGQHYQNTADQREYERSVSASQWSSIPQPFARLNLEFMSPPNFGPPIGGINPLGDWRLNLLGEWRSGDIFKYTEGISMPDLDENFQWKDYYNLDLRLTKNIQTGFGHVQLFVDVSNILNLRFMHRYTGFEGDFDWEAYMHSLHIPEDTFGPYDPPYDFIPGDDRPGDYRKPGVEYVPIEIVAEVSGIENPHTRPLYYENNTAKYMVWRDGAWQSADTDRVSRVLEDKAYIDMPNETYHTFLNPRRIQLGLRVTF